ncbi:MAG: sn-glycerol-1-phosphate dehydrogenase [Tannerella sp.]|jgi:glycerol-1-phosphate dehydrogenase [NAD(P)+]|nr:sn-glycerol-1-phosphate dehydrogenase [Tannerella sp.]
MDVENALKSANETKALVIGRGVLAGVSTLFNEQFTGERAVIIADDNTYKAAGKQVGELLKSSGIRQDDAFIFDDPDLYAEYSHVDTLTGLLQNTSAIPVAVGSGTINDLTKLSSHLTGRPYLCVATAASMDGYTSFGASITADGAKQTFNCPAPRACIADIDIISKAPSELTAAGYADLFAKIPAGADWILADAFNIEPIDAKAWEIVQDGLKDALSDPEGARKGDVVAIEKLIKGLMLGGFAMQWTRTSRPASGAEHQFSHLWNMEHHLYNGKHVSHGFQVSLASLSIIAFYEQALKTDMECLDIDKAVAAWPTQEELDRQATEIFKGTDFPDIGVRETRAKYISREQLYEQLQLLTRSWPEIKSRLEKQLLSYESAKERLQKVGAPVEPEQIGLTRARLREAFVRSQFLRRRFTVLDLAVRTDNMSAWLDGIFGKGRIWDTDCK